MYRWILAAALSLLVALAASPSRADIAEPGDVLVATIGQGVVRIELDSLRQTVAVSGIPAWDLGIDRNGDLIAASSVGLSRVDVATGQVSVISSSALGNVEGLAFPSDGSIDVAGSAFWSVDPTTGVATRTSLLDNLGCVLRCGHASLGGIALEAGGGILATLRGYYSGDPSALVEVDPTTGATRILAQGPPLDGPWHAVLAPDGTFRIAQSGGQGSVLKFDPATGEVAVIAQGGHLEGAYGIALVDDGRIVVTTLSNRVVEVDPASGRQRVLLEGTQVRGIAVVPGPPRPPTCSNGIDDDGDGQIDYPRDRGCSSPEDPTEQPPCADGIDNDHDGLVDAADPGCQNDGVLAQEAPQCQDGADNDGDGLYDYPDDPDCLAPYDNTESWRPRVADVEPPPRCGLLGIEALAPIFVVFAQRRRRRRRGQPK